MKKQLAYYVYKENVNTRTIEKFNVLYERLVKLIETRTKTLSEKSAFANEVDSILRYYFWAKSECEIVLTDWPPHIDLAELTRLQKELSEYETNYGHTPYSFTVNLRTSKKIDIYEQIKMNWDLFIDYLWNNLK